jgi:hypothetical protein
MCSNASKHLDYTSINQISATSNNQSVSKKQTNSPLLMTSSIDSIDGSVVLVMVDGSGQRRNRECYKCVMTTLSANERCMSRSIAPMRSFAFSADRDLLEFSRLRNKSTSLRSPNICSRLMATSFIKSLLLSRVSEGASASYLVYNLAASFVPNFCLPSLATSFVKSLLLSRVNEGAPVSCSLNHSATSFVSNRFLCTMHFPSHFEINFDLLYLALDISIGDTFGISKVMFRANYFSLNLHFTKECEITPVSEYFNFYSHKVFEFYEILVKVLFSGFCLDSSLLF